MKYYLLITLLSLSLFAQNEKISLQLQWKHQFQFAGFYVAKEKGYYSDEGLDVDIKEYDHSVNIVDDVVSQQATYGLGRSSLLISRYYQKKPIIGLAAIFQISPSVLITTNPDIKAITDLRNKRIMITNDEVESASITSMLISNSLSKDDVVHQVHSFDYHDLIKENTDAMACYMSNEPYHLKKSNMSFKIFNPKEYGFDFYGDILFTSEHEINKHPNRVKSFNNASRKGWLEAFENIEETAKLIYEKYNTQNKSLESLIYEGKILKDLALIEDVPFGHISKKKLEDIIKVYQLSGLLKKNYIVDDFINTLGLNKYQVKIGVLAKGGYNAARKRWSKLSDYLNKRLDTYNFKVIPLAFDELKDSVENSDIDFVITNSMYYVQLENKYGISRIASLMNTDVTKKHMLKEFGGVIFTRSDNKKINRINDLDGVVFGGVSELSFGGWIMAYEELIEHGIKKDDIKLKFLNTHDDVVKAVVSGEIDAGTVRSGTIERMASEGLVNLSTVKIINEQKYDGFPYLVSTKLYPEWPFAKLKHTSDILSNKLLSELVQLTPKSIIVQEKNLDAWTVPLDYSSVHAMLKKLRISPYDNVEIKFIDILEQYAFYIYFIAILGILLILRLVYAKNKNDYLSLYSKKLDDEVQERTRELNEANEKLKVLASTDFLTGINNRGSFMNLAQKYFDIAKRNNTSLEILSLDLDHFKSINDTYGHEAGDKVLIEFTNTVKRLLRDSDVFGRTGGEEFCIILQNTSPEGSYVFAERLRQSVEDTKIEYEGKSIKVTVSIGMAAMDKEENIKDLIKKSDVALYKAKESGRNKVHVV